MSRIPGLTTAELRPEEFDQLLNGPLSYRAVYQRAHNCPCQDSRLAGPDPKCPVCGGVGRTWEPPTSSAGEAYFYRGSTSRPERLTHSAAAITATVDENGQAWPGVTLSDTGGIVFPGGGPPVGTKYTVRYAFETQGRMFVQGIRTNREWLDRGEVQVGDLEASIPAHLEDLETPNPAWLADEGDLFIFPDLKKRYQQRLKRPGLGAAGAALERLTYERVHEVTEVRAIVGGALVKYPPADYHLDGPRVVWNPNAGPPPGTPYILELIVAPAYWVFKELLQMRQSNGLNLPRRVGMRLFETYPGRKPS